MVDWLETAHNLPAEIGNGLERVDVSQLVCKIDFNNIFNLFFLPIILILIIFLILRYKEQLINLYYKFFSKRGYVKILYRLENRRVKEKLVKLDKYNNFTIGKRKYSLEKMFHFIYGYDKYNFPIFLYDFTFILPLTITKENMTNEIIKEYNLNPKVEKDSKKISAVSMKLDSNILHTVYDKKLISDLYSISGGSIFENKLFIIIAIIIFIIIAYYTGLLQDVLGILGVQL